MIDFNPVLNVFVHIWWLIPLLLRSSEHRWILHSNSNILYWQWIICPPKIYLPPKSLVINFFLPPCPHDIGTTEKLRPSACKRYQNHFLMISIKNPTKVFWWWFFFQNQSELIFICPLAPLCLNNYLFSRGADNLLSEQYIKLLEQKSGFSKTSTLERENANFRSFRRWEVSIWNIVLLSDGLILVRIFSEAKTSEEQPTFKGNPHHL